MVQVTLTPKGERWHRRRHPWNYRDDIQGEDLTASGQVVQVKAPSGQILGQAFYNPSSKISLRWLTDQPEEPIDRSFWARRLTRAFQLREGTAPESNCCRLVYSEADGLPGLIIDRYGSVVVLQCLSLGMERWMPTLQELILEILQPTALVARNDSGVRAFEGLPQEKKLLAGSLTGKVEMVEGDCRMRVDVMEGHKTGAYLDQGENRFWIRPFARGRVLDAFAYHGGFTLHALAGGAEQVLAIEDSASAVEQIRENLALNSGPDRVQVERANAFDRLRSLEKAGEKFDLVILDPPAFAKNRKELSDAARGYREINLRALLLLNPGGVLVTCSCSYLVTEELFLEILRESSADSGRTIRLLEVRGQARDHPVLMTHPESRYLKCVALQAV